MTIRCLALKLFWISLALVPHLVASDPYIGQLSHRREMSIEAATLAMESAPFTAKLSQLTEKLQARLDDRTVRDTSTLDGDCSDALSKLDKSIVEIGRRAESTAQSSEKLIWRLICDLDEKNGMPCGTKIGVNLAFSPCNLSGSPDALQSVRVCLSKEFQWIRLLYGWMNSLESALTSARNATNRTSLSSVNRLQLDALSGEVSQIVPNVTEFQDCVLALEGTCESVFHSVLNSLPNDHHQEDNWAKTAEPVVALLLMSSAYGLITRRKRLLRWMRSISLKLRSRLNTNDDQTSIPRRRLSVQRNYELPRYQSPRPCQSNPDERQNPQSLPTASHSTPPAPADRETSETKAESTSGEGEEELRPETDSPPTQSQRNSVDLENGFSKDMREELERAGVDVAKPISDRTPSEPNEPEKNSEDDDNDDQAGYLHSVAPQPIPRS